LAVLESASSSAPLTRATAPPRTTASEAARDVPRLSSRDRWLVMAISASALALALAAIWYYSALALTLSHYDAKAHLVVARRIFDSLTPGWRQVGAVWLPLPHVLNALPVQIDAFYRSGASGVAISSLSFVVAVASAMWLVLMGTGSRVAAVAAAVLLASDPNVLYLQATPMTEALLLALLVLGVTLLYRWTVSGATLSAAPPGLALAAACLTRYEAWPVTVAALAVAVVSLARTRGVRTGAVRAVLPVAAFPIAAVLGFLVLSRATVGSWFVTDGFYVIDNKAYRRPFYAVVQVWWGLRQLVGTATLALGAAVAGVLAVVALRRPHRTPLLLALALAGTAALPWYAFVSGHPFRIRYMVVLVGALAVSAGLGVGLLPRRARVAVAMLLMVAALYETPPFSSRSPLVAEAQWDRPTSLARREVTRCLARDFRRPDEKILASMGSLAHYMQELSHAGFVLSDFVHEGIGEIWPEALASPQRHVEWILFEEQAEGGDELTMLRRRSPEFVLGFSRVCQGGGVALYRRNR
jgi:hypothetical protein